MATALDRRAEENRLWVGGPIDAGVIDELEAARVRCRPGSVAYQAIGLAGIPTNG